jgi:hypothetical protein
MGVKGKPDIIDIIEKKKLRWYSHVKRMSGRENTLINFGMGTREEEKKRTF